MDLLSFLAAKRNFRYSNVHEAVCHGDVSELEAMVKDGASVNEIDDTRDRFTPMHWACHRGALEVFHTSHRHTFLPFI